MASKGVNQREMEGRHKKTKRQEGTKPEKLRFKDSRVGVRVESKEEVSQATVCRMYSVKHPHLGTVSEQVCVRAPQIVDVLFRSQ